MPRTRRLLLLTMTAAVLALHASSSAAADPPLALGMNMANAPGSLPTMQSFASMSGADPALVMWYQQWSEPLFYSTQLPNTRELGAIPLITWDPIVKGTGIPLAQIADGSYDSYITQSADAARAWQRPIFIRFAHEMNIQAGGYGPRQNGNTAADFIAAWRHVVTIFRAQDATNVEWVWSPNVDCNGKCPFTSLYPGDAWVDWVALDGYNYSSVDHVPWMTFDQIFKSSYNAMTALTRKPMMIAEMASAEAGGNKAQWITQTFSDIAQNYSQIHAVVWFDRIKETDWTVNSSPSSLAAWRGVVASPEYQGTASTLLQELPLAADVDSQTTDVSTAVGTSSATPPATTSTSPPSGCTSGVTAPTAAAPPGSPPAVTGTTLSSGTVSGPATTTAPSPGAPTAISAATGSGLAGSTSGLRVTVRKVRTAVIAALRGFLRRRGGLGRFVRSLRTRGETISFTAVTPGTIMISVYLDERRDPPRVPQQVLVATVHRTLRRTGRVRVWIRPSARGRFVLRHESRGRITVRLCFVPRGNRRLAASATVRSG